MPRPIFAFRWLTLAAALLTATICSADVQVWLLVDADRTDTVLSSDAKERDVLQQAGWKVDGTGRLQLEPGTGRAPLHRMYRPGGGRKLEIDAARLEGWTKEGYVDEGVLGHAATQVKPGLVPVYHVSRNGRDLWLINPASQQAALKAGWKFEPTRFWLWPATPAPVGAATSPAR